MQETSSNQTSELKHIRFLFLSDSVWQNVISKNLERIDMQFIDLPASLNWQYFLKLR